MKRGLETSLDRQVGKLGRYLSAMPTPFERVNLGD